MMTISPKLALWLNIVLAIALAITSGVIVKPPFMSDYVASCVTWGAGLADVVGNIVLHAFSAPGAGPLVKN